MSLNPRYILNFCITAMLFLVLVFSSGCTPKSSTGSIENITIDTTVAVLDTKKEVDNVFVLLAASATLSDGLGVKWPNHSPKNFWVEGIGASGKLVWEVYANNKADFHVDVLLDARNGEEFTLENINNHSKIKIKISEDGWDKIDIGTIKLEEGINQIEFLKETSQAPSSLKSLELVKSDMYEDYQKRVAAFKADTKWLANSDYGLMFQYGPWSYPEHGEQKKTPEELATTFDINNFVKMVESTGASYVIWSLTWWDYSLLMPCSSIDKIIGNSNRTTSYNFIGKLAKRLKEKGIRFMLYYHLGHASHMDGETDWWKAQNWPSQFATTGMGNRELFFRNWMDVITEIGDSLGTNLDGWWFDDGLVYYPAPFEEMGKAARSGNPERLIAYNSWICARYTDFQDMYFGEGSHGEPVNGSNVPGGNGVFTGGPQKGLLQHAMFVMENDWGVHKAEQKIQTKISYDDARTWLESAKKRKVPLSFNLMMWEDGTISRESLEILQKLKSSISDKNTSK